MTDLQRIDLELTERVINGMAVSGTITDLFRDELLALVRAVRAAKSYMDVPLFPVDESVPQLRDREAALRNALDQFTWEAS